MAGEVYVVRISDDPARFEVGAHLLHEDGRTLVIETARAHRDRFLIRFEGISTRTEAERLRGALYIDASDRRLLGSDEYWPDDLVGCTVTDISGHGFGTVTDVTSNPAQDLLVVDGKHFVPMVKEIVVEVDVSRSRIIIDPPEGLFP